jgi:glr0790 protein
MIAGDQSIAYISLNETPTYEFQFVKDLKETNEEDILLSLKESAQITYVTYAVTLNNETEAYVKTVEEAEEIVNSIKEEYNQDLELDLGILPVYTEGSDSIESVETEIAQTKLDSEVKAKIEEQEKIKAATVNGIYLAVKPISGTITSRFSEISSIRSGAHTGLDIAAPKGTAIKVVQDGTVTFAGSYGAYGYCVKVSHGNGVETWYAHCSKIYVSKGEDVTAGDTIAAVGSTGNSTGNHLHLEVRIDGSPVNPQRYLYR